MYWYGDDLPYLWLAVGVIRRLKRDSLPALAAALAAGPLMGSIWQDTSKASLSSMMRTDSNHLENLASR